MLAWSLTVLTGPDSRAAEDNPIKYSSQRELTQQLQALAAAHPNVARVAAITNTPAMNPVWLAELGNGPDAERIRRPALLVVAGLEGDDLTGTACAMAWIGELTRGYGTNDAIRRLLDSTTIYVWPRLNPDAAEQFFAHPRVQTAVSPLPVDDDHDGLVDEDGPEDLNGDGLVTWMRVQDPEGDHIQDPNEPRLLLKADRSKGESGVWRYLQEGRDNDGDGLWNEDGLGGVNFNRNFPYNYRFFSPGSGPHPVSERETRALADFVVDHPNIGIVFTFGAADNLVQTPKGEGGNQRPPINLHDGDLPYYREMGKVYRDLLGLKKELQATSEPGTFSDWMYYHRGRFSLAARAWSPTLQVEWVRSSSKPKTDQAKENKSGAEEKPDLKTLEKSPAEKPTDPAKAPEAKSASDDKRGEEDRAFLKWLDEHAPDSFRPWKAFAHPDFPGKKVEIGGFAPFALTNPPEKILNDLARKQSQFLTQLAGKLPRVGLRKAEAKSLEQSVFELTIQVENSGYLPTALAQGTVTGEIFPTRLVLDLDPPSILSGAKITRLNAIEGSGGMTEFRFIVHAPDRRPVGIEVISMLGGSLKTTVNLKD